MRDGIDYEALNAAARALEAKYFNRWVRIPKGTLVRSTGPGAPSSTPAGATHKVFVRSVDSYGENPTVVWSGTGGYWKSAPIRDVELIEP